MNNRVKFGGIFLLVLSVSMTAHAGFFDQLQTGLNGLAPGSQQQKRAVANQRQARSISTSAGEQTKAQVVYSGYSAQFLPVKQLIYEGKFGAAAEFYETNGKSVLPAVHAENRAQIDKSDVGSGSNSIDLTDGGLGFLNKLEHATLLLDSADNQKAIKKFEEADRILSSREEEGTITEKAKSGFFGVLGSIVGNDELGRYEGEGFEKVLMLNYWSIGYLVNGDRRAYNVARKAMDWQQLEERQFQKRLAEAEKKLAEEKKDENASEQGAEQATQMLGEEIKQYEKRAKTVASAYVNPFGWYVNAMIQEFESYQDPSLWSNARIAYQKAYDLNPKSSVIKAALKDTKKRTAPNKRKRLVHILVADGFAPEKKVLQNEVSTPFGSVPLKLSLYEPVPNRVHRIEVRNRQGKRIASFSTIADIEALALRHQQDSKPFNELSSLVGFIRGIAQAKVMSQGGALGQMLNTEIKKQQTPDTRSWMSLPSRIQGVRLHLSSNVKTLQLVSLDKKGKTLGKSVFKLSGKKQEFVYARSVGGQFLVQMPEKLWIQGG